MAESVNPLAMQLQKGFATGGMRFSGQSALGQKQTSRHLQPMSALPPKADIADSGLDVR
jgi:hypothetical protein